ncbi:MAG: hypothetical protein AB1411_16425 [Nitrospirota bacterium]
MAFFELLGLSLSEPPLAREEIDQPGLSGHGGEAGVFQAFPDEIEEADQQQRDSNLHRDEKGFFALDLRPVDKKCCESDETSSGSERAMAALRVTSTV